MQLFSIIYSSTNSVCWTFCVHTHWYSTFITYPAAQIRFLVNSRTTLNSTIRTLHRSHQPQRVEPPPRLLRLFFHRNRCIPHVFHCHQLTPHFPAFHPTHRPDHPFHLDRQRYSPRYQYTQRPNLVQNHSTQGIVPQTQSCGTTHPVHIPLAVEQIGVSDQSMRTHF